MGADNAQIKMIDEFIAEADHWLAKSMKIKQLKDEVDKETKITGRYALLDEERKGIADERDNYFHTVYHCYPNDFKDVYLPRRDYDISDDLLYIQTLETFKRKLVIKKDKLSQYSSRASANLSGADNQFDSIIDLVLQILERSSNLDDAKEALRAVKRNRSENN